MSNVGTRAALVVGALVGSVGCVTSHGSGGGGGGSSTASMSASTAGVGGAGGLGSSSSASAGGSASASSGGAGGGGSASSGSASSGSSSSTGGGGIVCPGASISCSGNSVDPCADASNCGSCGHDCQGAACLEGVCQPVTLASGQAGVYGVAVDATSVYWSTDIPNGVPTFKTDCAVMKMPVAGGAAVVIGTVATSRGYDIAVDATRVYLTSQWNDFTPEGEIFSWPLGGGGAVKHSGSQYTPRGLAVGPSYVYWADVVPLQSHLAGASLTGGPAPTFIDPMMSTFISHGIALDATSVYTASGYQIVKWPAAGGPFVSLAMNQPVPNYIAVDATNLYWTNLALVNGVMQDHQGTVVKMPKAGGAVTTLASGIGGAERIAIDATHVYWNDSVDGLIMKVPIAGGAPTVLATGQMGVNGLAVDGTHVYWTSSTGLTVMKVAK